MPEARFGCTADIPATVVVEHRDTGMAADHNFWVVATAWRYGTGKEILVDEMLVRWGLVGIVEPNCPQVDRVALPTNLRGPFPAEEGG